MTPATVTIRCVVEDRCVPGTGLRAEHGLAWHIETPDGQVLFDTGESGDVLLHNAALLGIDLGRLDALALSHAHRDHTGGLASVLAHTRPAIPLYASPDLFRKRFVKEEHVSYGMPLSRRALAQHAHLCLSAAPVEIMPGVWTTGEITERPAFEGRGVTHLIRAGGQWQPDPYRDDLSLVLQTARGRVVVLGCGHAGLLNILRAVVQRFSGPIVAVLGGTHLVSASEAMLRQAVDELRTRYESPRLYPNHCTGAHAYEALAAAFGDRVQPCPAGTVLTF